MTPGKGAAQPYPFVLNSEKVITFSHGWPLNADVWDGQMLFLTGGFQK
jgi:pimeloyl-ACP methyl ester carboxylesterase